MAEVREPMELESVIGWRAAVLIEAGYPAEESLVMAERKDVDLHKACELLERGCDVKLALRILL